ncbi:ABC transporter substrate-binding protein [Microbacterium sp.]|uniref:ABC transporter substrate-binding protein n=1 Tax=Microbacterium sp. TaxID=51671 RepID=UPI0039E40608
MVAATLLLAGCSSTSTPDGAETATTSDSLLPAAEGKTQYPLTLTTPWGETTLEKRPERVAAIAVSGVDTELLVALGVTPITTSSLVLENAPWTVAAGADKAEKVLEVDYDNPVPKEALVAVQPDLILGFGRGLDNQESFDLLSKIAPVVTAEDGEILDLSPWQEPLRVLGKALDLSDRAEKIISDYEAKIAGIASEHPEFEGKTLNFIVYHGGGDALSNFTYADSAADSLLTAIGFAPNTNEDRDLSLENLSTVDGDVLLFGNGGGSENKEPLSDITDLPVYQTLQVVKDDRVVLLDSDEYGFPLLWALAAGKVLGQEWLLDQIVPLIAEKVE